MSTHTDLNTWDDRSLVERASRRGGSDDRPFTVLFERHQRSVWSVCYRFTGDAADAEDLLQEVFIKAYRSLFTFQGRSSFRTWLYQIALNTCRNELRRRRRRPAQIVAHIDDLKLVDHASRAMEHEYEERENIAETLLKLHTDEREILVLKDIKKLSYANIAGMLGIHLSAAKMRVQRARLAFIRALNSSEQFEERS